MAIYTVNLIKIPRVDAVEYCQTLRTFVRSSMFFGHWHFGSMQAKGRVFRAESRYYSNDGCGPHCHAGRVVVSTLVQRTMCPIIPDVQWLMTYTNINTLRTVHLLCIPIGFYSYQFTQRCWRNQLHKCKLIVFNWIKYLGQSLTSTKLWVKPGCEWSF